VIQFLHDLSRSAAKKVLKKAQATRYRVTLSDFKKWWHKNPYHGNDIPALDS
jgi:hypothetical protein